MFSSCLPSSLVSNLERPRSSTLSRRLRHVLIPHPRKLRPFTKKNPKNSPQEIPKEKENGIVSSVYPKKGAMKGCCRFWCVCGSYEDLDEAWVMKTFKAGSLEKLVEYLVPAYLKGDFSYIKIFLGAYRTYATTQQVLDQLLQRYGCNHPSSAQDSEPQEQLKGAISFILGTWLKEYLEDFNQPPDFPCLKLVVEYVQVNMPGSHLERCAQLLLAQLDQMEVTEAEPEAPEPGPAPVVKGAQELSLSQEPAPGQSPGLRSVPVAAPKCYSALPTMSSAAAPAPDGQLAGGVDPSPGSPPEMAPGPQADVTPAPAAAPTPELQRAPAVPSPAPSLPPDPELPEGWDSYHGPPPEPASVPAGEVDPAPAPKPELHRAPLIPSPAPTVEPDEEPAGGSDSYPGPPSELVPGPPADVNPAPAPAPVSTLELDVAQVFPEVHHEHQVESQMERWISILSHLQNQILDHQLTSILLLLQHRRSTEHQLFCHELQLWQQMGSPLEDHILNQGQDLSRALDHLVMSILTLYRHRRSIQHRLSHHQMESPQKSWIFSLGNFENTLKDHFLSQILLLQQHWSRIRQQVLHHQVEHSHLSEGVLKHRVLSLVRDHNELLDRLVRSIMRLD